MGGACSMYEGIKVSERCQWENLKGRYIGVDARIILKQILRYEGSELENSSGSGYGASENIKSNANPLGKIKVVHNLELLMRSFGAYVLVINKRFAKSRVTKQCYFKQQTIMKSVFTKWRESLQNKILIKLESPFSCNCAHYNTT